MTLSAAGPPLFLQWNKQTGEDGMLSLAADRTRQILAPGAPAYHGEHNEESLRELQVPDGRIRDLQERSILLSRRWCSPLTTRPRASPRAPPAPSARPR